MQMLANASLISNDSMASNSRSLAGSAHESMIAALSLLYLCKIADLDRFDIVSEHTRCISALPGVSAGQGDSRQRRRWDKDPPERLLNMLEKAQLQRAFSTFLINKGGLLMLKCILIQPVFLKRTTNLNISSEYFDSF